MVRQPDDREERQPGDDQQQVRDEHRAHGGAGARRTRLRLTRRRRTRARSGGSSSASSSCVSCAVASTAGASLTVSLPSGTRSQPVGLGRVAQRHEVRLVPNRPVLTSAHSGSSVRRRGRSPRSGRSCRRRGRRGPRRARCDLRGHGGPSRWSLHAHGLPGAASRAGVASTPQADRSSVATAIAAAPSPRPTKPIPSPVVAFTLTAPAGSAERARQRRARSRRGTARASGAPDHGRVDVADRVAALAELGDDRAQQLDRVGARRSARPCPGSAGRCRRAPPRRAARRSSRA